MAMGELESAVMAQLWDAGRPLTVRVVHERLAGTRALAYSTVMTVLVRLAQQDLMILQLYGRSFHFSSRSTREQLTAELMLDALQDATDPDARVSALQHVVGRVSPVEAAAIRAALSYTD